MLSRSIFVAIFSFVIYGIVRYLVFMDTFKSYHKHYPGICKRVKGARLGSEDMAWTTDGLVFISSGLPFPDLEEYFNASGTHGEIQLFDFNTPSLGIIDLKIVARKGFDVNKMRPHGLCVLENKVNKEHLLYVVNHQRGQRLEQVEKFQYHPDTRQLTHLRSIVLEGAASVNDISVVAEDQFYVSNFMLYKDSFLLTVAQYLVPLRLGGLFFYDGSQTVEVATGLETPNGNCLSKDKKFLYVVSMLDEALLVYERDGVSNKLRQVQTVDLSRKGDNVHLSASGDALLVGSHPVYHKLMAYTSAPLAPSNTSPSSILRLLLGEDGLVVEKNITELFYDHGDLISAASIAVSSDQQLLVGSIIDSAVHCQLK